MARTLERPTVHPEVHPDIHPDVHPGVDEFIRKTLDEHEVAPVGRRPVRWMRWLTAAFLTIAAVAVVIMALPGEQTEYAVPRTADGTERWLAYSEVDYAVPRTADGTELWMQYAAPEYAVPTTADGTVRWMTYTTDFAVPRSADGRVMWFEYLTPQVPRTADGAEGWLLGVQASETPVLVRYLPMGQVPDGVTGEVTYLPVTPPTSVVPGTQVELAVQPVFVG